MMSDVLLHSVIEKVGSKIPLIIGYSVSATLAIVYGVIDKINGVLQTGLLLVSIAVGIATFIYTIIQIQQARKNKQP